MRRCFIWLSLICWLAVGWSAQAAHGRVIKELPQFLDLKGRNSLSPSLYERDNYQALLRQQTNLCSGMRFYVQWKVKGQPAGPLKLRVELRGVARGDFPKQRVLEKAVVPGGRFSHWAEIDLIGEEYKDFGQVTAWRVTLWEGAGIIGEQKSYLW